MNRQKYNKVASHPLQTWEWGEFRKKWGNEVIRTDYGQLTLHKLPFVSHKIGMFIKGPAPTKNILDDLKSLSKNEKLIFIKLEPNVANNKELIKLLKQNGAVPGKTLFTPTSFWIDLTINEEDLMKSFQSKTRYNIRLAQRKGVEVREDNSDKAFERYIKLTKETVERQGFYAHSEKYHRLMWKTLYKDIVQKNEEPIARLLVARYKGEIITTWIVFVWKDFLYYPYGASSNKHKNVMANNLVMWEAIKYGKKLGLKTFDLWGREPGKGFTRFKEGYRPKVVEFLGTWDLITNPFYYLYRVAETLRWALLRFRTKLSFARPKF
jgi:lipid II:glycine glycyltransferase (peptidoglycan interpeptide bridge formation enzyme)